MLAAVAAEEARATVTVPLRQDLWAHPYVYLLFAFLIVGEWLIRKWSGLA